MQFAQGQMISMYAQETITRSSNQKFLLQLGMWNIDELFPGFSLGDFAVIHGSPSVSTLISLLCVRAQLPPQLGGLGTNVVFVDGANTFKLYQVTRIAQLHQLNPKKVLDNICISRAFTAYQLTSLVLQKIENAVKEYNAKLIVISDIASTFLDKDIAEEEAKRIYSQVISRLVNIARENNVLIITTYPPHSKSPRDTQLQSITCEKANVVIRLNQSVYEKEFVLEKHPNFMLGTAELPSDTVPLTAFM